MGLSDLKITIKSIITSSPKALTPRDLLRDFKELEGYDFPYQKCGFSDFIQCLTSQEMSDTVQVKFEGGVQVVTPVLSEKSKHIDLLVMKQKSKPPRVRSSFRRAPIPRRRVLPPRMSSQPPRYDSKPYQSSSSYQSNSYHKPSYSSSTSHVRQFSNPPRSVNTSNYQSNQSYSSFSTSGTRSSYPSKTSSASQYSSYHGQSSSVTSQAKLESVSQTSKPLPLVPTFMKDKVIDFMKSRSQGVGEEEVSRNLLTGSFRDYGIKTIQSFLDSFPDVVERRNGYIYPKKDNYKSNNSSQSNGPQKYTSPVPAGFEDEAFDDDPDCCFSDEDYYYNVDVAESGNKYPKDSIVSNGCQQSDGANLKDILSDEKSTGNYKSQSVCSFESDSGCFDAANEKMGNRMRQNFQVILDKYPDGISLINLGNAYLELFNCPINFQDMGFSSTIDFVSNHPSLFFCYRWDEHSDFLVFDSKKEIPFKYKLQAQSSGRNKKIPPDIYENLKQLLMTKKSSGILSTDLIGSYKEKYGTELNLEQLGFDSVNSLFTALSDLCYLRPVRQKIRAYPRILRQDSEDNSNDPDLFHIPVSIKDLFPSECCDSTCKIPTQRINKEDTQLSDDGSKLYIEICISEVYSPGKFWFHLRSKTPALNTMMDDLDDFYTEDQRDYCMPSTTIAIGQICATKYSVDGRWHRVRILSIPNLHEVTVYYLDYGTVSKVAKSALRFLHKDFEEMPAQAIHGRLSNLKPREGNRWTPEANTFFFNLTDDVDLMAEIADINTKNDELEIEMLLFDTNGEEDIDINQRLIDTGHAALKFSSALEIPVSSDVPIGFMNLTLASRSSEAPSPALPHSIASSTSSKMESPSIDPPPGFQRISTPELYNYSNSTSDLEDGVKSIARHWSSDNLNQQSTFRNASNLDEPLPLTETPSTYSPYLAVQEPAKKVGQEASSSMISNKDISMMIVDSICKAMSSVAVNKYQNSSNPSELAVQNQYLTSGNTLSLSPSLPQKNYSVSSLSQQQNPIFSNSQSQISNSQLSNSYSVHQFSQQPLSYQAPQSLNFHQSTFVPNNLQNHYLQNPSLHPSFPPGLINPSLQANKYMPQINRHYPSPPVPNAHYPFNPMFNKFPQVAQAPNQLYANFQMQNSSCLNPLVPNQLSNFQMQNSPCLNPLVPNQPYSNNYAPLNSYLPTNLENNHRVPSQPTSISAFATSLRVPPPVSVTPGIIQPVPSADSSSSVSSVNRLLPSLAPQSGVSNRQPSSAIAGSMNSQTNPPLLSRSPSSKEVEEIMDFTMRKEAIVQKIADEIMMQKLKQSAAVTCESSQSSNVVDIPVEPTRSSPATNISENKAAPNSSKPGTKNESPFGAFYEQMNLASSSPTGSSNLLHTIFPQLDQEVHLLNTNQVALNSASARLVSNMGSELDVDCDSSNQLAVEEFQSDHISSTMPDSNSKKQTWEPTWNQVDKPSSENQSLTTSQKPELAGRKASSVVPENMKKSNDENSKTINDFTQLNLDNLATASFVEKPRLTDSKLSSILPNKDKSISLEQNYSTIHRSPASGTCVSQELAVAGKVLHLLLVDSVYHIITDEFMTLFTKFTRRLTMLKILEMHHINLPFQEYPVRKLSRSLPEEFLSLIKKYEKFEKVNILPLKNASKLAEVLNFDDSLIEEFCVSAKKLDLAK